MKRFVRYWAIRLLGREFVAQTTKSKLVNTWFLVSLPLLAGTMNDQAPWWLLMATIVNCISAAGLVIREQNMKDTSIL